MVTPDLLCHVTVAIAKFIYVLLTHLYSTLTPAYTSPALVLCVAMTPSPFTPLPGPDAARGVQGHTVLPFWTCFRPSLLVSSLSLAIMYYSVPLWVMDHG